MKRGSLAGLGALAFGVLTILGLIVENAPGGSYSAKDVGDYVRSGHRPLVFLGAYLGALGIVGLVFLLARLRELIADESRARVFWGLGLAAAGALSAGIALTAAVPIAIGYGGNGVTIAPAVTFVLSESGWVIMTGGCVLLGSGLLTFVASAVAIPAWMRWATAVAGLAAIAAAAWFPLALVILWSIAIGIWLLVRGNAPGRVPATA
jgi:hypothetical protein